MLRLSIPWIWKHPLGRRHRLGAYGRYLWWQCRCRLTQEPHTMPWVRGSDLRPDPEAQGGNQLWVHNLSWAQERLKTAPAFSLLGDRI